MTNIQELRLKALKNINFPIDIIKTIVLDNFTEEINETSINDFIKNIAEYDFYNNLDEVLFKLEEYAFKKVSIFMIKEKNLEEITNDTYKMNFISRNRIRYCENKENLNGIGEDFKCTYYRDSEQYFTMKVALIKTVEIENPENGYSSIENYEYYDFVKFVVDKNEGLLFMFYNDISYLSPNEDVNNDRAVTNKKSSFYNLFIDGNKRTLTKYFIDEELNEYVIDILQEIKEEEGILKKVIPIIETEDPVDSKNNLRSSTRDARHNKYRLQAIKYAIENEDHNIKTIESLINGRHILFRNKGEIILPIPYFGTEVIRDVCREVFPKYRLSSTAKAATGTYNS